MSLQRQLLLVSLLILSLPWAGCQYIREIEKVLRDGQSGALVAKAQAIASHLAGEPQLFAHESVVNSETFHSHQLYLHPLPVAPQIDGFGDSDWSHFAIDPLVMAHPSDSAFSIILFAGVARDTLYLFIKVRDLTWQPHDPQQLGIANGDHIIIRTGKGSAIQNFYFRTTVSGNVIARYFNSYGEVRQEHRIRSDWQILNDANQSGYQVEMQLPLSVVGEQLGFSVVNRGTQGREPLIVGTLVDSAAALPWVSVQPAVENILRRYRDNNQVISVVDRGHWLLARQGSTGAPASVPANQNEGWLDAGWLRQFYQWVLGDIDFPAWIDPARSGRIDAREINQALTDEIGITWYNADDFGVQASGYEAVNNNRISQRIGRVAVPIVVDGTVVGAVAVEQGTDSILLATQSAFSNLVSTTLIAWLIAGLGLLSYASILSFRIRRLSRAADNAVMEDGRIRPDFLRSKAKDQIGDLTRSYGQLLGRLREYTDYLRTLSSKLSHELRTPLAVVRTSLDNLEGETLSEDMARYTNRAKEGVTRLNNILNAMSAASHMEDSIKSSHLETFNLAALLTDVGNAYRDAYPTVQIRTAIDDNASGYQFHGSPDLIVQMLDKLVDNAADFVPPQGLVSLALSRDKNNILLSVSNDGPPLPEHMQGQLFDSLVSVREPKAGKGEEQVTHLGLGLYIVRLIADFHGGAAAAHNLDDGSGVCFVITLPLQH